MLNHFYQLILFILLLNVFFIKSEKYSKIPNRDIIILLDDKSNNMEGIDKTLNGLVKYTSPTDNPSGIGAMTITYLIAMHQKAAPILVDKSLINNILNHKEIFEDFATKNIQYLKNKYSRYNRFKSYSNIQLLQQHCVYIYNKYDELSALLKEQINNIKPPETLNKKLEEIVKDKRFNIANAPKGLNIIDGSAKNFSMFAEVMIYFLCYNTFTNINNWTIKKISNNLFLFIPNKYLNNLDLKVKDTEKICKKTDAITSVEKKLGLRVNHLKDVTSFKKLRQETTVKKKIYYYLQKLFVTDNSNNIWSIYIAGHGFPAVPLKPVYDQLKKLEALYNKESKSKNFRSIQNLKKIKNEIDYVKNKIATTEEKQMGIIVSLPKKEFQSLLLFFNNKINTSILYYTSCFAGGDFLIEPYKQNSKDLILNYHVISGTLAENMAIQEIPLIKLPPYSNKVKRNVPVSQELTTEDIDIENKTLMLKTTLQYQAFFDGLKKGLHLDVKNLPIVVHNLHPYTDKPCGTLRDECLGNIPSVRLAGSNHFTVIPHDDSFLTITDDYLKNQKKSIDLSSDKAALIYSTHIKPTIAFNKKKNKRIPVCVSMVPGLAAHTFEEISAPEFSLPQLLGSFLCFPELSGSKIFFIKKLKCAKTQKLRKYVDSKQKTAELSDVVIMRNILNSDSLHNKKPGKPPLDTCIYFTEPKTKKSLKITWDGPTISEKNYKINQCQLNEHKHEILAYDSNLKQHISDIAVA